MQVHDQLSRQDLLQLLQDKNGRSCASLTPVSGKQQCFRSETHTPLGCRLLGVCLVTIWSPRLSSAEKQFPISHDTHGSLRRQNRPGIFLEILTVRIVASCRTPSTGLGKGGCKTKLPFRPWVFDQESHKQSYPGSIRKPRRGGLWAQHPWGLDPSSPLAVRGAPLSLFPPTWNRCLF